MGPMISRALAQKPETVVVSPEFAAVPLNPDEEQLLEEMEKANFQFFWEQANPQTGLIKDRSTVRETDNSIVASIAATGFGLTAICIAQKRGYVSETDARERVILLLRFLWEKMPHHRGFFFHFANVQTGERIWDSEISSIDTAILLCGILTCRAHFRSSQITHLATDIFNRVEWTWLSEDTNLLPHGWTPGQRVSSLSLERLQRADDDVSAGSGLGALSASDRCLEGMESQNIRIRRIALHRFVRAPCLCINTRKRGSISGASRTSI